MKNLLLTLVFGATFLPATFSQTLTGTVTDENSQPVPGARVTLYNADTSLFWETRTDALGQYWFSNLPGGGPYYFFGVAKPGKAYFQNATTGIIDTVVHDAQLLPETEPGFWQTIMDSPEPLGGTDLGVLLPDGNIYYCHNTKDPFYFLPVENDTAAAPGHPQVQGCVGPILLADGQVVFFGGTLQEIYGPGCRKVKTFDPSTGQWAWQPDMLDYRWYPTVAPLSNGKILIAGGGGLANPVRVKSAEVYDPATGASVWCDTLKFGNEVSAIVPLLTGKVLMTFRPPQLFDPATLQWEEAADFVQGNRLPNGDHCDHEVVMLADGRVVAVGYKSFTPGQPGVNIEIYDPEENVWTLGSNLAPTRSRAKAVLLPDQKILVLGGYKEQANDPTAVNNWGYMALADQYDPLADSWRRLAPMNKKREYHAISILVPDGRVIVVGGEGQPGNEPPQSVIEAFSPPYLFRGIRPILSNFNKTVFKRGETIGFEAHLTNALTKVVLLSNAVSTHFMNSGNGRFLEMDFTQNGNQITVNLPADSLRLMPGFYMLFGMVDDIPSEGQMLKIEPGVVISTGTSDALQTAKNVIRVSPNPVSGANTVSVEISASINGQTKFIWHDAAGRQLALFSGFEKTAERQRFLVPVPTSVKGGAILSIWVGGRLIGSEKVTLFP